MNVKLDVNLLTFTKTKQFVAINSQQLITNNQLFIALDQIVPFPIISPPVGFM